MNITRRDDEPGKLNLSFSVGVTHIVDESELLEKLAEAGVLYVEQSTDVPAFETVRGTIYPARSWFEEFERFAGPSIRYVSPWKEAK